MDTLKDDLGQFAIIAVMAAVLTVLITKPANSPVLFSPLFSVSEAMLKSCVFHQKQGFNLLSFLAVAPLRMFFLVPFGYSVVAHSKERHLRTEPIHLMNISYLMVLYLALGLVEPLIIHPCY